MDAKGQDNAQVPHRLRQVPDHLCCATKQTQAGQGQHNCPLLGHGRVQVEKA